MRLARVLGGIGRVMITAGVLVLLFVVYQLWGTGIRERQAQDRLERRFRAELAQAGGDNPTVGSTTTTSTSAPSVPGSDPPLTVPPSTVAPLAEAPAEGDPVGRIEIPKIGLDAIVVEGVADDDLKQGPGHYEHTPLPGQKGNVALAGHRTTYGAPFANIDQLQPGDKIVVTTVQGRFTYSYASSEVVAPSQTDVLQDKGDDRITLTACHPKWSASERIVITGRLEGEPVPTPPTVPPPAQAAGAAAPTLQAAGLSGKGAPSLPALLYGSLCAAIWVAAWLLGRWWRKWPSYLIGLPFFLVALFYFFENFSRLLPANF